MNNYSQIAQLGRKAAMEKMGVNRTLIKALSKAPSQEAVKALKGLGSTPKRLEYSPKAYTFGDKLGPPGTEFRPKWTGDTSPPKDIRSAVAATAGTLGVVGGGAALSSGYGPGGKKSNEIIDKIKRWAEPLNRLLRGSTPGIRTKAPVRDDK